MMAVELAAAFLASFGTPFDAQSIIAPTEPLTPSQARLTWAPLILVAIHLSFTTCEVSRGDTCKHIYSSTAQTPLTPEQSLACPVPWCYACSASAV